MPRKDMQSAANGRQVLTLREPNAFGVRCGESQADGIPCPGPDCDCDDCQRAYVVVTAKHQKPASKKHA